MMVIGALCLVLGAAAESAGLDGLSLSVGGTLGAAIVGGLVKIYTSRKHAAETKIPQPCDIHTINDCVSVKECNRRMKDLDDRVTRLEVKVDDGFEKIEDKLEAMDRKSEERSAALHRRLDKLFERIVK